MRSISTSLYLNVKERRQLERNHIVQSLKQAKSQLKRSFCCLWNHDWGDKTQALKGAENVLYLKPGNDYMVRIFILKTSTNSWEWKCKGPISATGRQREEGLTLWPTWPTKLDHIPS